MKIKRILITGDDGYNAIGIRLLAHYLKDDFDLYIAGTKDQQSAVGGHLSLSHGGTWGMTTVEGVPAFWVDGYPCDAIECMVGEHKKPFDLVLSGINLGMNVGATIVSSGTYSAGIRALGLGLAPRAIILSWFCPPAFWAYSHDGNESIEPYLAYPGKTANNVIRKAIKEDFWGADLLNINFPSRKSSTIRFTKGLPDFKKFFRYPLNKNQRTHTYFYPSKPLSTVTKKQTNLDTGAILSGYISITPHKSTMLDNEVYTKVKDKEVVI